MNEALSCEGRATAEGTLVRSKVQMDVAGAETKMTDYRKLNAELQFGNS